MFLGMGEAALLMWLGNYFRGATLNVWLVFAVVLWLCVGFIIAMVQFFLPYAIIVLGVAKLREQRREELEALGDENVVHADPDGERKLHEYLTAMTSMEARIGLLQRSDPYIPPEQRAPEGTKPPRAFMSKTGWSLLSGVTFAGFVAGILLGHRHGLGTGGENAQGVLQLLSAGFAGLLLSAPFGLVAALLFGRITQVEEADDAGAGGPETA